MSTPGAQPTAPGWYPDPAGSGGQRWHDGQGWTGQVMHARPVRGLGKGFAMLADWLGRGLVVCGLLYGLLALAFVFLWMNPPDLTTDLTTGLATQPGMTTVPDQTGAADATGSGVLILDLAFTVVALLTQVTWLVWQYRLAAAAPAQLRRTPAMHVVWWFIPFANLIVPRRNIGELWHAYGARRIGSPSEPAPAVFSVWWALWISPFLLMPFLVLVLVRAATPDAAVAAVLGMMALMFLGQAFAGLTARTVVRELSWRALLYWSDAR